jgi:hypothetical protein
LLLKAWAISHLKIKQKWTDLKREIFSKFFVLKTGISFAEFSHDFKEISNKKRNAKVA